jgi:phosphomannomutase
LRDSSRARPPTLPGEHFIVTTIVSSPLAAQIARAYGARVELTLTGFKWIVQRALQMRAQGMQLALGFEEALGYCIGDQVHDKDGIAAAAHVAQMARWHAAQGGSLWSALQDLYLRHGLWQSRQVSLALTDPSQVEPLQRNLTQLRRNPPTQIAGLAVTEIKDLLYGPNPDALPSNDVCIFHLAGGQRVTIRPSGTEPKLKLYLDCTTPVAASTALPAARAELTELLDRLEQALREMLLPRP